MGKNEYTGDFNNFINYKKYIINTVNCLNQPTNENGIPINSYGTLLVEKDMYSIHQIFFPDDNDDVYIRRYNSTWTNWQCFATNNQILNSMLNSQSSNNGYKLSTYIVFGSLFNNFKIQLIYDNASTLNEREVVFPILFTNYPNLAIGYNNFDNHILSKLNVYTKTLNSCVYIKDIQDVGVHITAMQF